MPFGIHELLGLSSQISPAYPRNEPPTPTTFAYPTNYPNAFAAAAAGGNPAASCTVQSSTTAFPCSFDAAQMARQHFIAAAAAASGNFDGMMGFRNHQPIDFGNGKLLVTVPCFTVVQLWTLPSYVTNASFVESLLSAIF